MVHIGRGGWEGRGGEGDRLGREGWREGREGGREEGRKGRGGSGEVTVIHTLI